MTLRNRNAFDLLMLIVAICIMATMTACAQMTESSFNEQAAITMRSVTAARDTSTALMQAKKISLDQDAANQKKLDAIVEGVKNARALQPKDPVAATAQVQALKIEVEKVK